MLISICDETHNGCVISKLNYVFGVMFCSTVMRQQGRVVGSKHIPVVIQYSLDHWQLINAGREEGSNVVFDKPLEAFHGN